jgi:hypothetical protein
VVGVREIAFVFGFYAVAADCLDSALEAGGDGGVLQERVSVGGDVLVGDAAPAVSSSTRGRIWGEFGRSTAEKKVYVRVQVQTCKYGPC